MAILPGISGPRDLDRLTPGQLSELAAEIRSFLIENVARTGGHLGPNLGVVELTIALHRVFSSPDDPIIFDTGHQSYVHKLLTGRQDFSALRSRGGLAGYPQRSESAHDVVESSHASSSLSWADGISRAFTATGRADRHVVAVVGDGALTGGMTWEALNNIAAADRPVIIVVNDNGRSYAPTAGGLAQRLNALRLRPGYERTLGGVKGTLPRVPVVGPALYSTLHGVKRGIKDLMAPQPMFEDLGLKYVGPVDGHDRAAVERALRQARRYAVDGGPVLVHCITRKGCGYAPAEDDELEQMHAPGAFDPVTGRRLPRKGRRWTEVFGEELVAIGAERSDVVAITAAMCEPTGLVGFAEAFPDRFYDVGIAEQHALTSAAGLAMGGVHPVVAVYSTFLNRAFDQLLMDVALHKLPVTIALDRAGVTGDDGASHNGMWDLSVLGIVPGLRVAAPRDEPTLRGALREAVAVSDGPTVLRSPKTPLGAAVPARRSVGGVDVLFESARGTAAELLLVSVGATAPVVLAAAAQIAGAGRSVRVVDPRWVQPLPAALVELAREARLVVSIEDGVLSGGVGSRLSQLLRAEGVDVPLREIAIPQRFLAHGKVAAVRAEVGLAPAPIAERVEQWCTQLLGAAPSWAQSVAT